MTSDQHQKNLIKQEILDRYDLYDIINLLGWDLEGVYNELEELLLDDLERLEINVLEIQTSEEDSEEGW